jgi:hypothetical protein
MERTSIPILAEVLGVYYSSSEFTELAVTFDVPLEFQPDWEWIRIARQLVEKLEHGNYRVFLKTVLEQVDMRNSGAIASTKWEARDFHDRLAPYIERLREELAQAPIPAELAVPENRPFAAKSEVREFLEQAETEILVVDPYVGVGTLDCFRSVHVPVRLLTGAHEASIEARFEVALKEFQAEGFQIEVRQHPKLHDRHIAFNDRCWLVGSSLKDAGKKAFHVMEMVDAKAQVVAGLEAKWTDATLYPAPVAS